MPVKTRGTWVLALLALLLAPAWAGGTGGKIKTSAPVYNGVLTVTLHFQGTQAQVLSQETPGELHLLLPETSRLVKLVLDRPDRLHHEVKPALVNRSYQVKKKGTISGGVVSQEDYKEYTETQVYRWRSLPPGLTDVHVESFPDDSRFDVTGLEIPR